MAVGSNRRSGAAMCARRDGAKRWDFLRATLGGADVRAGGRLYASTDWSIGGCRLYSPPRIRGAVGASDRPPWMLGASGASTRPLGRWLGGGVGAGCRSTPPTERVGTACAPSGDCRGGGRYNAPDGGRICAPAPSERRGGSRGALSEER